MSGSAQPAPDAPVILKATGIGKAFRAYGSELDRVIGWFGIDRGVARETWVLRNVSFSVRAGEALAIAGQNGAGKSTLLKIITGTLRATTGNVWVAGRVAAILELGLGFNPDLTGRQNAFHVAGLMGHAHDDIAAQMDAIEAFAEIGSYFDQPVRVYSSGMQMRVAFAVVTAFRPDLLIVDEALSVGDTYFQHKSIERIRQFREAGTALLLVSHDKAAIQSLCSRVLLLEKGEVLKDGPPADVMDYYNALIAKKVDDEIQLVQSTSGRMQTVSGTREATIESVGLFSASGASIETVAVNDTIELRVRARVNQAGLARLVFGYAIKDRLGQVMYGTNTHLLDCAVENPRTGAVYELRTRFPVALGPGSYSVTIALTSDDRHLANNYEWRELAALFTVVNLNLPVFDGVAYLPPDASVAEVSEADQRQPLQQVAS